MIWLKVFYAVGAIGTLLYKAVRYVYDGKQRGSSIKHSLAEWMFEGSADNVVSWIATIAVVWIGGTVYITQTPIFGLTLPLPHHPALALLLGSTMEMSAPGIGKWLTQRIIGLVNTKGDSK